MMKKNEVDEIVATGDLFKQARRQTKNWTLRKFLLSGIHLTYFDDNGVVKGRIDITGCMVRRISPEECKNSACKFAFGLFTSRGVRRILVCATNEIDRTAWINALEAQIEEYRDIVRRFISSGEIILGNSIVTKKNMIGLETTFRLVLTNYPRLLIIDNNSASLKEQIIFKPESLPTIQIIDDLQFVIKYKAREFKFKDSRGSSVWATVFRDLPRIPAFVPKPKPTLNIGQVMVTAAPSEASVKRAGRRKEELMKSTNSFGSSNSFGHMPNLRSISVGIGGERGSLQGSDRGSSGDYSPLTTIQLLQMHSMGADYDEEGTDEGFDEGVEEYEYDNEDVSVYEDYEDEDEVEDDEDCGMSLNESIEFLKTALTNISEVVKTLTVEIENMGANKKAKQEIVRNLMMNVQSLTSNLQGLYQQGMNSARGIDSDLIATITDVVDETADLLKEMKPSTSGNGNVIPTKEELVSAVSNGIGEMSNRVANHITMLKEN